MKTRVAVFCALLVAGGGYADPYSMSMQQARRTADQNNAEQQRIQNASGGAPAQAAAPSAAPVNPALQATLSNISSLQADFKTLGSSTSATPDPSERVSLLNNLSSAAQGNKASSDSIKKLADDLLTAVSGKNQIPAAQQTKLARDIHAIFNSAHLTDAQQKLMFDDVQKILTDGGVSLDNAVDVVTDLKKVSSETK
jgi:hypothetical protein